MKLKNLSAAEHDFTHQGGTHFSVYYGSLSELIFVWTRDLKYSVEELKKSIEFSKFDVLNRLTPCGI